MLSPMEAREVVANYVVTDDNGGCHYDNLRCHQGQQNWHHHNSGVSMNDCQLFAIECQHDDVTKWKHFPCYWPFVPGIHRSPNSPHKGQWHGALMFSLICAWTNGWVNNHDAGELRRHRTHCDVTAMGMRGFRDFGLLGETLVFPLFIFSFVLCHCPLATLTRSQLTAAGLTSRIALVYGALSDLR